MTADHLTFSARDTTALPSLPVQYDNTPYGNLKLIDIIDCSTDILSEAHGYTQSAFGQHSQDNKTPGAKVSVLVNPILGKNARETITVDEGGGYYDSGYVQPLDFFGDGTRIPLIVVSPYSQGGRVVHDYSEHVSILKFIERNWRLPPITNRSRDNLPNPIPVAGNPYVPANSPAIDDLLSMFRFP